MTSRRRTSVSFTARAALAALGAIASMTTTTFALAADEPPSPPPPHFGQAGQIVFADLLAYSHPFGFAIGPFMFSDQTHDQPATSPDSFPSAQRVASITFAPSADVIVFDHVTLGARAFVNNTHWRVEATAADGTSTNIMHSDRFTLGVTPRVGYVIALTRELSLWPRAGAGVTTMLSGSQKGGSGFNANGEIALVYQPVRALILSIGPELTYGFDDALDQGKSTNVILGGFARAGLVF